MRVGVDLLGSDHPPQAIFEAVLLVAKELQEEVTLVAITDPTSFPALQKAAGDLPIELISADEAVEMDDSPLLAVRRKKNSSMAVGMRLLKEKELDAFVSTGNTGALIATASLHLPTLPTITRPALLVMMPTAERGVAVLDVGANISFKPTQLADYARLGVAYRRAADNLDNPRVGLLNIGVEELKGTDLVKKGFQILTDTLGSSFLGNVEGRDVFHGKCDVLVTDGFTGNVFLKTCEGASTFLVEYLSSQFQNQSGSTSRILTHLNKRFNYAAYPGALLLGVDGLVMKCHGNSSIPALTTGIRGCIEFARLDLTSRIRAHLT